MSPGDATPALRIWGVPLALNRRCWELQETNTLGSLFVNYFPSKPTRVATVHQH